MLIHTCICLFWMCIFVALARHKPDMGPSVSPSLSRRDVETEMRERERERRILLFAHSPNRTQFLRASLGMAGNYVRRACVLLARDQLPVLKVQREPCAGDSHLQNLYALGFPALMSVKLKSHHYKLPNRYISSGRLRQFKIRPKCSHFAAVRRPS